MDAQGGKIKKPTVEITYGDGYTIEVPTKTGYEFLGWYDKAELGKQITDENGVSLSSWLTTEQVTLYANWKIIDYTVKFDGEYSENIEELKYNYGDEILLPTPTRVGYAFNGWYITNEENTFLSITDDMYGDMLLKSSWTPNKYNVILNCNGGSAENTFESVEYDKIEIITVPNKYGYTFVGWYLNDVQMTDSNGKLLSKWTIAENDKEFIAKYQINEYTVTFITNSEATVPTQKYKHGETIIFPEKPVQTDMLFNGWYIDEDLTTEYLENTVIENSIVLYAKWIESTPIATPEDFLAIKNNMNANYHLVCDINFHGNTLSPLPDFNGILDGQGYKIFNFAMSKSAYNANCNVGIFTRINGTVKDLTISQATYSVTYSIVNGSGVSLHYGALAAISDGKIINCTISDSVVINSTLLVRENVRDGTAKANYYVGGIIGESGGIVSNCKISAPITVSVVNNPAGAFNSISNNTYIGGIVSVNHNIIENCISNSEIVHTSALTGHFNDTSIQMISYVGGITGLNIGSGLITKCEYLGNLKANGTENLNDGGWNSGSRNIYMIVGGIVGENSKKISQCKSTGSIQGSSSRYIRIGGVCGQNNNGAVIQNSFSSANVEMTAGGDRATGGFVGMNGGNVRNCYSFGHVKSKASGTIGGFVGYVTTTGSIMNCVNFSNVETTSSTSSHGYFYGELHGTSSSNYYSKDCTFKRGETTIAQTDATGVTMESNRIILTSDFIYNTLFWEDTEWSMNDGQYPTLCWENLT